MATIYVKKDGSGNSTTIQGAIPLASSGDIIEVEAGTFVENIDFYKNGITINGAGKDQTIISGEQQTSFVKAGCTWTLGATTISVPAGTSGLRAGHIVSATGLAANTRIVSVGPTSFTISAPATVAKTNVSVTMAIIDSAVRWRGDGNALKNVKVQAIQALATRAAVDQGAIYFRVAGLGAVAAANYLVENCEIEAKGDSAIMCDNTGPAGGTVTGCTINGQTFVGAQPAQVHAFSSLPLSCNVLTSNTIELPSADYLVDVKVGSPILAVTGFIQSSTTVSAINGIVLTLSKTVLDFVGTTQTVTFTNIQFNIPNVARQLVVFQPGNSAPVTFTNNIVNGLTGGGISYNQAVTCDVVGSTVSGNTFNGDFGLLSYALRVRGINSVVENNFNDTSTYQNAGYYVLPNHALNVSILSGTMIFNSSKYWLCIQDHTSSAANAPTGVDGALYWSEITLEQVNASGTYGVGLQVIGSNTNELAALVELLQENAGDPIQLSYDSGMLKAIPSVSGSATFSNEANWYLVGFIFKHTASSKRLYVGIKNQLTSKAMLLRSGLSSESYELDKVILSTSDRTLLAVQRNEIEDVENYDITLK